MGFCAIRKCLQKAAVIWSLCAVLLNVQGQENPALLPDSSDPGSQTEKTLTIRVGVEEVRLDAVVLDKKGRQITDLTADDFEIYQDRKRQRIVAGKYIADYEPMPATKRAPAKDSGAATHIPAPRLSRDAVRRTIVFLVDDYSMQRFEEFHRARVCLRKFVEDQMQPGDLIAILQTFRGTSALSAFTSDKKELLARIENIHYKPPYLYQDPRMGEAYIPQPMAIDFCIGALKDMPGRKYLMLMSLDVVKTSKLDAYLGRRTEDGPFNRISDAALRAGVVIHTLDILGLADDFVDLEASYLSRFFPSGTGDIMAPWRTDQQHARWMISARQQDNRLPYSQKTGGEFLTGTNFFNNGIAALEEHMKGYYLLSYVPPASTFSEKNGLFYKKIEVKVKRRGARIYTRDGFVGLEGSPDPPAEARNPLIQAMFSPFRYKDLNVCMASGYVEDSSKGYQLRAWIHLDGRALGITDEKNGGHSISVDAVAATSDIDGKVRDSAKRQLKLALNDADVEWIRAHGLRFSLSLHKEEPGGYYVRVAIKDQVSGAIGSAYEFLEIPDLKKGVLSLSSIVVLNNREDADWVRSATSEGSKPIPDQSVPLIARGQALRKYRAGESFEYMATVYNAKTNAGTLPDLESQVVLFGDGRELFTTEAEPVRLDTPHNVQKIPIRKNLLLQETLPPGDYVLKLQVRDRREKGRNRVAEQLLQFEISAK